MPQCPPCQPMPTRSPALQAGVPGPTASTTPAISWPGTRGNASPGQRPSFVSTSLWQIPEASMRTRTNPGRGRGSPAPPLERPARLRNLDRAHLRHRSRLPCRSRRAGRRAIQETSGMARRTGTLDETGSGGRTPMRQRDTISRRAFLASLGAVGAASALRPLKAAVAPEVPAAHPGPILTRAIPSSGREAAARRARKLDHVQRRRRRPGAQFLRRGHGRLLPGGRPADRLLADVRLVAGGHRVRPRQARASVAALRGRQGLDVLGRGRPAADRGIAAPLGHSALRPARGPQPDVLGGSPPHALRDEEGGPAAATSASRRPRGGATTRWSG